MHQCVLFIPPILFELYADYAEGMSEDIVSFLFSFRRVICSQNCTQKKQKRNPQSGFLLLQLSMCCPCAHDILRSYLLSTPLFCTLFSLDDVFFYESDSDDDDPMIYPEGVD
jgi:hypothetical protein